MLVGWLSVWVAGAVAQEGTAGFGDAAGAPDFYVIQEGDTLWDISTRFLGDPYEWPELWSVNEYITNPHWIYPGNRIYFRLGDALNPPSAGLGNDAVAVEHTAPKPRVQEAADIACDFPPLFERRYDGVVLRAPGVLSDKDTLEIRGTVYKSDAGREIGEGALVYLDMDDVDDIECGGLLALYRQQGHKVRGANGPLGHVFRVLATAQVLRVDDHIVTARLRDSYIEVERGDLVGTVVPVDLEVDVTNPSGDLEASIVARLTEEQYLAGTGETVFLDRGTNDGIDVGESLFVVERRAGDLELSQPEDPRLPEHVIGRVVVVRAEEEVATGVVVDAARELEVGMRVVGTPNAE